MGGVTEEGETEGESPLADSGNKSSQDSRIRDRAEKGGASQVLLLSLSLRTPSCGVWPSPHYGTGLILALTGLPEVLPPKRHLATALLTSLLTLTVWLPQGYLDEQVAGRGSALHYLLEACGGRVRVVLWDDREKPTLVLYVGVSVGVIFSFLSLCVFPIWFWFLLTHVTCISYS